MSAPVATLTVWRLRAKSLPGALWRMASGPPSAQTMPGLRFARLLGTARGKTFGPWDHRTWALFAVWESEAAVDAGLLSPQLARWEDAAEERWTVRAQPLSCHGRWGGALPFGEVVAAPLDEAAPVMILTRASIRPARLRTFRAAAAQVERQLPQQPGLVASLGAGESPWLDQATFSLWSSAADAMRFAYGTGGHPAVVRQTRAEGWYREELFARLRPTSATGSWAGREPLALARGG